VRRAAKPALYYLEQTFAAPDGSGKRTRKALIARVRLHRWTRRDLAARTYPLQTESDRLSLLRACGSQQGQIFMLYRIPAQPLPTPKDEPAFVATDDYGVVNKLWKSAIPQPSSRLRMRFATRTSTSRMDTTVTRPRWRIETSAARHLARPIRTRRLNS